MNPVLTRRTTPDGKRKTLGAIEFVRRLEEVLICTCADFAIPTKRVPGLTGVWTDPTPLSSRAAAHDPPRGRPAARDLMQPYSGA